MALDLKTLRKEEIPRAHSNVHGTVHRYAVFRKKVHGSFYITNTHEVTRTGDF